MRSRRGRWHRLGDRAAWHAAAADAFSAEVDGTDHIVKESFFRLSGTARERLFAAYARNFGEAAAAYARETVPSWRSGEVRMSARVAQRLYALMPPFMSSAERRRIIEVLWRRYAGASTKYLYVGPDVGADEVIAAADAHFEALLTFGNLPLRLSARFEWLSGNDAVAARRLLAEFGAHEKDVLLTTARAQVAAMQEAMRNKKVRWFQALSHAMQLGRHRLVIGADPLRQGLLLTDSPS
ncbi:MAG: hypothetical protein QOD39_1230, partial [Mycobacterium sp.]|nr:hypothetical protein [Mycobacterium sp.]